MHAHALYDNDLSQDPLLYMRNMQVTKVSRDARETVQECVSEFLQFITSEASEICLNAKRTTVQGEDIIKALQKLGFDLSLIHI